MPDILSKAADLYVVKVQELLNNSSAAVTKQEINKIFPSFDEKESKLISELAEALITLVPALVRLFSDRNNLFNDRALAASAVCYLISPFDIIPDEHGLVGTVDDGLIAFGLAARLEVASDEIAQITAQHHQLVSAVYKILPEWVVDAISDTIQLTVQQRYHSSAMLTGEGV